VRDNRQSDLPVSGTGLMYLLVKQVNNGSGQLAVSENVVRGNGSGTGLSYQHGANQLTVSSAGNTGSEVRRRGPSVAV
jgi:hypothetical protein